MNLFTGNNDLQYHQQRQSESVQHNSAAFSSAQTYDPASNNGRYSGPSSYEVQLGSYTRNI